MQQSLLLEQIEKEENKEIFTPVCGGNFQTPVVEQSLYTDELRYTIGEREFIENAD